MHYKCRMCVHVPCLCKGCCVFSGAQVGTCALLPSLTFSFLCFPCSGSEERRFRCFEEGLAYAVWWP